MQEIADALPISRPPGSPPLRLLKAAGLVADRAAAEPDLAVDARPAALVRPLRRRAPAARRVRRLTVVAPAGDPFEALGDPTRRQILSLLGERDRSVAELAGELPVSRPAVSRHLRLLKAAGLVADRAEGTRRLYRLHDDGIEAVRAYLEQVWGEAAARFRLLADNTPDE